MALIRPFLTRYLEHAREPDEHDDGDAEVDGESHAVEDSAEEEPLPGHNALLTAPRALPIAAQLHLVALRRARAQPPLSRCL